MSFLYGIGDFGVWAASATAPKKGKKEKKNPTQTPPGILSACKSHTAKFTLLPSVTRAGSGPREGTAQLEAVSEEGKASPHAAKPSRGR